MNSSGNSGTGAIIAFDCAGPVVSAGLLAGEAFFQMEADGGQKHSSLIMDMAADLLRTAGLKAAELTGAACMKGPGSFTGLRIGFAAVKGLALALDIPYASVPTLDCLAFSHSPWPGIVVPVIDAKKKSWWTAFYRSGKALSEALDAEAEDINSLLRESLGEDERIFLTGPDAAAFFPLLGEDLREKTALDPGRRRSAVSSLLTLAKELLAERNGAADFEDNPVYLRKSDAELKIYS